MNATSSAFKSILRFILYAGAVGCGLAGFGTTYLMVTILNETSAEDPYGLALGAIYICLSFTPGVMLLTGLKTKTWHWVSIATAEVIVLGLALCLLLIIIRFALNGFGE